MQLVMNFSNQSGVEKELVNCAEKKTVDTNVIGSVVGDYAIRTYPKQVRREKMFL